MSFLQVPVDVVVGAVLTCPPEQVMLRVVPRNYLHNVAFESRCVHTIYWYGVFSHDVTAAILCPKTMKRRPCWCYKPVLWKLNSFLM